MSGFVTGSEPFIIASYVLSGLVIAALSIWACVKLVSARKKLSMLEDVKEAVPPSVS